MSDQSSEMDMALASLRSDVTDLSMLLRLLASQLADALGSRLVVERSGGLLHRSDEIKSVRISIGNDEFVATSPERDCECTIGHRSGGIRIRSEQVDPAEWLQRLTGALRAEAERSDALRHALETMVIGGSS